MARGFGNSSNYLLFSLTNSHSLTDGRQLVQYFVSSTRAQEGIVAQGQEGC